MTDRRSKVTRLETHRDFQGDNGGNGGGRDDDLRERVAKIEAHMQHLATKADLQSMEAKMLKWQIGILITVVIASCLGTAALIVKIVTP